MKKIQQGFTLIELMIVVAIVGILAAVALPAYQDYTRRAHVSEGLGLAEPAKAAITEYYADRSEWPKDNAAAGLSPGTQIKGNAVKSVEVDKNKITITYSSVVDPKSNTIELEGTANAGSVTWTCAGGSVEKKYRPARCR